MKITAMRDARGTSVLRRSRGFTLVEALVALLALSIGLLGVAGLQLTGLKANMGSSLRSQATYLSLDILDRIRANRGKDLKPYEVAIGSAPSASGVVQTDLLAWKASLATALPAGDGAVVVGGIDDKEVTITVQWDDSRGAEGPMQFTTKSRL